MYIDKYNNMELVTVAIRRSGVNVAIKLNVIQ